MMIRRQKEQEHMKNASVKEMIRKQKLEAEERKEMVSTRSEHVDWLLLNFVGTSRKENVAEKSTDK